MPTCGPHTHRHPKKMISWRDRELLLKSAILSWVKLFTKRLCWEKTGNSNILKVSQEKKYGQLKKASVQSSQQEPKLHSSIIRILDDWDLTGRLADGPSRREKHPACELILLQRGSSGPVWSHEQPSVISRYFMTPETTECLPLGFDPRAALNIQDHAHLLAAQLRSPGFEVTIDLASTLVLPLNKCVTLSNWLPFPELSNRDDKYYLTHRVAVRIKWNRIWVSLAPENIQWMMASIIMEADPNRRSKRFIKFLPVLRILNSSVTMMLISRLNDKI